MALNDIKGLRENASGNYEEVLLGNIYAALGVGGASISITGDVTGTGTNSIALSIGANKVTLGMMAQMTTASILGRYSGSTGNVEVLSPSTVRSILNVADGATNYAHPSSHSPSIITQDASNRFVTDTEKADWNSKQAAFATNPPEDSYGEGGWVLNGYRKNTLGIITAFRSIDLDLRYSLLGHDHTTLLKSADFAMPGIMLRGSENGTYDILTNNSDNWNTAYGWGNHASAGYLTSLPSHTLANHTVSGLTTGYFLKALSATTFGFVAHGLTYSDVGAASSSDSRLTDARTPTSHSIGSHSDWPIAISMTEVGYLDGVTSAIQTQLGNKSDSGHTHSYQAADADLLAIGGLTATSGYLKKTAADTWTLDTSTFSVSGHTHDYTAVFEAKNSNIQTHISASHQTIISGSGFVKASGTTLSYDNTTYVSGTPWTGMGYLTAVTWATVSGKPTTLSAFTNDLGNYGSFVTGTPWTGYGYVTGTPWTGLGYITSSGSVASATYAANASKLYSTDSQYAYGSAAPYYGFLHYDGTRWRFAVSPATPADVGVAYADVAASANAVAWSAVSSKPTALSQFSNDLGNYGSWITASGNAATATTATNFNNGTAYSSAGNLYSTELYVSSWLRTSGGATGMYNSAYGTHFYAESAGVWNVCGGGGYPSLKFRDTHNSTVRGLVYSDGSGFGLLNNAGNWMLYSASNSQNVTFPGSIGAANFSGSHTGSSSGTNTGDQTSISGNAGTATSISGYSNPTAAATANTIVYRDASASIYADTFESGGVLELQYYGGTSVVVGQGATGNKPLYAGSLYDGGNRVIHAGNIGSQSVSYATSAGNASNAGGLAVASARNDQVNQIVRTNSSGYCDFGWINSTSGIATGTPARVFCSEDAYIRYYSMGTFTGYVQAAATGHWEITVNSADSASYATTAGSAAPTAHSHDYATHRGEGTNYVDYSRYVYNNGAYSGSGWIEPSDLGVRYASSSGSCSGNATGIVSTSCYIFGHRYAGDANYDTGAKGRDALNMNQVFETGKAGFLDVWGAVNATGMPPSCSHVQGFQSMHYSGGYGIQIAGQYDQDSVYVRQMHSQTYRSWRKIIDSGNIASQSVSYASTAGSAAANDVYAWAKAASKPGYGYSEVGACSDSDGRLSNARTASGGTADYATYLWATSHVGSYYMTNYWTGTYWRIISNHSSGCSVQHATYADSAGSASANGGNADSVDSQHFAWSNADNNPSYLWGANSNGSSFLAARGSMSVNYANYSGYTTGNAATASNLASGATAAAHGTATTAQVINAVYGTGAAPAASGTPEGTIYLQYTA